MGDWNRSLSTANRPNKYELSLRRSRDVTHPCHLGNRPTDVVVVAKGGDTMKSKTETRTGTGIVGVVLLFLLVLGAFHDSRFVKVSTFGKRISMMQCNTLQQSAVLHFFALLVIYLLSFSVGGEREHSHNFRSARPKPHL